MKSSPLYLDEFFLTKLNIKHVGSFEMSEETNEQNYIIKIDYDVARRVNQKNMFRLDFRVIIKPPKSSSGISIDSEMSGFFSFPLKTPEDDMQYLIRINGCAILYSLLRGQVAMITGSFPNGKVNIPTVVMQNMIKKKRRTKKTDKTK
ncbi:hypothetical protein KAH27_04565 [bacterium]|nr:hypothetical protein [bacterium]